MTFSTNPGLLPTLARAVIGSDRRHWRWPAAGATALMMNACGGGGNAPIAATPSPALPPGQGSAPPPTSSTMSGVAATGAPFAGARLTAVDSTGTEVCDSQVDVQGVYSCTLPATTKSPLGITARREDQVLYSVSMSNVGGRVNVTPLTRLVVSRLSPAGNPALLAAALKVDGMIAAGAKVQAQASALLVQLKPLLDALGDAVAAAGLPPAGTSLQVSAPMDRATACYALPLSQRVNASNDTAAVTGGPANVTAPTCRSLFVNDDPASYLNDGAAVGRDTTDNGSFAGLFRPDATGVVFTNANLEYFRPNGDLGFHYQTVDMLDNISANTAVARDVEGVLLAPRGRLPGQCPIGVHARRQRSF